ncbi:MAG: type II toxin-antitoxin system prevent-host-death family antitoxin [Isosphaeraceae bacterium]
MIASSAPGDEVEILQEDQIVARLVRVEPTSPGPRFGSARDSILDMADDFDAPLDEFKESME